MKPSTHLNARAARVCAVALIVGAPTSAIAQHATKIAVNHLPPILRTLGHEKSDWFSFRAVAGSQYVVETLDHNTSPGSLAGRTGVVLSDADKTEPVLAGGLPGSADGFGAIARWTADHSGTIRVEVYVRVASPGAQYEIQVKGTAGQPLVRSHSSPKPPQETSLYNPRPNPWGGTGRAWAGPAVVSAGRPVTIHFAVTGTHGTGIGAVFIVFTPSGQHWRAVSSLRGGAGQFSGSKRYSGTAARGVYHVLCFWHIDGYGVNGDVCGARTTFTVR